LKKSPAAAMASSKTATRSKRQFGPAAMLVTAMCVTGAVIVIAAHEMAPSARVTSTDPRPDAEVVSMQPKPTGSTTAADPSLAAPKPETEASKTTAANTAPVTIFGCLERSNETYRLTDTDGTDAPKARSWKSAFLKKGAATVEVVDPGNRARLSSHVGHRVGVTGTLSERQLQVRSIRRISSSCSN
ncbi:MAG: hypothetical protein ACJ731_09510, partial [Vicinamibacterales bacterium]